MENLTISQVSKQYDVTPRMLRHYEKLGLIETLHKEDYAYRMYDENAVRRLQQIIILRKLRIPLKQIAVILQDGEQLKALKIMQENIAALDEEIDSLDKIRGILKAFAGRLEQSIRYKVRLNLLNDPRLIEAAKALSLPKTTLKESASMSELGKAGEVLNKSLNVRIVLLPPFTVAAYTIKFPEFQCWGGLENWARSSPEYDLNYSEQGFEVMGGCLEEHLNWVYCIHTGRTDSGLDGQLDLLMPVKKRT